MPPIRRHIERKNQDTFKHEDHLSGFNDELFWHILWQLEKWTIKYLICSVCHWAIWWQGWHCPGTAWRWWAALPAARHARKPTPLLPPWLPSLVWRRCGINEQRKRLWEEGVVSAQRMLWNSSTCGAKQFLFNDCVSGFRFYAVGFESTDLRLPCWAALSDSQVFPFFLLLLNLD